MSAAQEGGAPARRAAWPALLLALAALLLALAALLPSAAYLWGYAPTAGPESASGWPVLLLCLLAPALWVGRAGAAGLLAALPLCFALPVLPLMLSSLPFAADRVWAQGCLLGWALAGLSGRAPRLAPGLPRTLLATFAAATLASALAGFWNALPVGAPLVGESLALALRDGLLARPLIDATHALERGVLRLEWLALAGLGLSAARALPDSGQRLARAANQALLLGLCFALLEVVASCAFRGQSYGEFFARGIPRNHRPLLDNNALGSALILLLPLSVAALAAGRGAAGRALPSAGLCAGLLLLYSTRSKAALAGAALALLLVPLLWLGWRRLAQRRALLGAVGGAALLLVLVQLAPRALLEPLESSRRGADLLRVLRLDFAASYLRENRSAPWAAALALGQSAPLFGAGLGRLPQRMAEFRDPTRAVEFNPTHENAHNQFLQSFAEEGLFGLGLLGALWGLAALCAARAAGPRQAPGEPSADAERWVQAALGAGLIGLAFNSLASHSLLETTPGLLFGACLGVGLARAPAGPQGPRGSALRLAPALAGLLALLPARLPKPPLEGYSFGCFPWIERGSAADARDRLLAPEAWWCERPPAGARLVWLVKDVRSWRFTERLTARLFVEGSALIEGLEIARSPAPGRPNPPTYLKADLPAELPRDRPALWRLDVSPTWTNSLQFETGRQPAALRVAPLGSSPGR